MDLSTRYLGLSLKNPIVASSSPLTRDVDGIKRLEDAGAAAVVLPSLFEEHIEQEARQYDAFINEGSESFAEALTYFPMTDPKVFTTDAYLKTIQDAKAAVKIPVIGSLNGITGGGWIRHACLMQEAGVDALELNLYYLPTDIEETGPEVELNYYEAVRAVLAQVHIPVAVKISPYLSSLPYLARWMSEEGVAGLVMFNRFYQPDFDLENLEIVPGLSLSRSDDLRLPLRWTAILYGRVLIDFAITSGVHNEKDVIKAIMAGANVSMMAAELLTGGPARISEILAAMQHWMEDNEYKSVNQMRGSMSQKNVSDPSAFERANYVKALQSYRPSPTLPGSLGPGRRPVAG